MGIPTTATATSTLRTLKYGQQKISRSMATTAGAQEPNRLTKYFQQMKQTCPETIRAYAQCVIKAEQAGNMTKGDCDAEFASVKACFREVRRS
jgi:hypothetical protein